MRLPDTVIGQLADRFITQEEDKRQSIIDSLGTTPYNHVKFVMSIYLMAIEPTKHLNDYLERIKWLQ